MSDLNLRSGLPAWMRLNGLWRKVTQRPITTDELLAALERLILKTEDLLAASGQRIQDAAQAAYQNGNITRDSYLAILAERKGKGGNNHEANI